MDNYQILSNGVKIPRVGLGVFKANDGAETANAVKWALQSGYRHIDTAHIYGNEDSVGKGIRESGIKREDIFVTTKVWNSFVREKQTKVAFEESLKKLGLDYLDLYLIHWPVDGICEAWAVMEELYQDGKIKAIGVSNFHQNHLDTLMKTATIKPMVNQIESNPFFNNNELIASNQSNDIVVQSWSPLGGTGTSILNNETLCSIAQTYNKSVAQIIIRWNIQRNVVVLPKSVTKHRIEENLNVYDFELSTEHMQTINGLNQNIRTGPNPDTFEF